MPSPPPSAIPRCADSLARSILVSMQMPHKGWNGTQSKQYTKKQPGKINRSVNADEWHAQQALRLYEHTEEFSTGSNPASALAGGTRAARRPAHRVVISCRSCLLRRAPDRASCASDIQNQLQCGCSTGLAASAAPARETAKVNGSQPSPLVAGAWAWGCSACASGFLWPAPCARLAQCPPLPCSSADRPAPSFCGAPCRPRARPGPCDHHPCGGEEVGGQDARVDQSDSSEVAALWNNEPSLRRSIHGLLAVVKMAPSQTQPFPISKPQRGALEEGLQGLRRRQHLPA